MGKAILYAILLGGGIASFARPWIGVCLVYFFVILRPQNIWWWNFVGVRPVYWILLPTIIGCALGFLKGELNLGVIKNKQNLYMLILWLFFALSYFLGAYIGVPSNRWWKTPVWTIILINKIFILYFLACLCINDEKKLKYLMAVMVLSILYLIYWANAQYLIYHRYGRIEGPKGISGDNTYSDNGFAMLFVTGLPFLYYLGWYIKKKLLRYFLWLVIPFGWHAVFLTGSRGGLVGLAVTILVAAFRSSRKIIGIAIIPLFIFVYIWQAGPVMKQRAQTLKNYQQESSAEGRINAWKAAIRMIAAHPITGVGLAAFGTAFADYSDKQPRQAHNTFFQIAAESGVIAGVMYLLILFRIASYSWNKRKDIREKDFCYYAGEAVSLSAIGFGVCSMFLSLQVYEIFYYLCVIANVLTFLDKAK